MEEGGDRVDAACRKQPSQAVVEAVADAEGISPMELQPPEYDALHAAVDPTALDELFAPRHDGASRRGGVVTFEYCGYRVTVDASGEVSIE